MFIENFPFQQFKKISSVVRLFFNARVYSRIFSLIFTFRIAPDVSTHQCINGAIVTCQTSGEIIPNPGPSDRLLFSYPDDKSHTFAIGIRVMVR